MSVLSRAWLFGRTPDPSPDPKPSDADWTCIVCERTFRADQPRFVDYEADEPAVVDLCVDCSH